MSNESQTPRVTGWQCAVCAATVNIAQQFPWRCPNSTPADRHHVLQIVTEGNAVDAHFSLFYNAVTVWEGVFNGVLNRDNMQITLPIDNIDHTGQSC